MAVSGRGDVRDGDSLVIGAARVRLDGVDAPELGQTCKRGGLAWPCGEAASRHLTRLIGGAVVTCDAVKRDQYQRLLGHCRAGGHDLNQQMVRDGMAVAYGQRYSDAEAAARRAKVGLWAGTFVRPQVWRQRNPR